MQNLNWGWMLGLRGQMSLAPLGDDLGCGVAAEHKD